MSEHKEKSTVSTAMPTVEKENNVSNIIEYSISHSNAYCNKQSETER